MSNSGIPVDSSTTFTRRQIQYMLEAAHELAEDIYQDRPGFLVQLQEALQDAIQACNDPGSQPQAIFNNQLNVEHRLREYYNEQRLEQEGIDAFGVTAEELMFGPIPEHLRFCPLTTQALLHNPDYDSSAPIPSTPPPIITKNKVKTKDERKGEAYDKFPGAPSMLLPFPDGNITLAEICAFLPQSIKSWDLVDRFIGNGVATVTFVNIMNLFRKMPRGDVENSAVYRMMQGQMKHRSKTEPAYIGWTVGNHQNIAKPAGYDPVSVSVTGFRVPHVPRGPTSTPDVLFRDLAQGLHFMPSGYDALDLMRCVRYCLEHDDEDWMYPSDWDNLLAIVPQINNVGPPGPATVEYGHTDAASVKRHTPAKAPRSALPTYTRKWTTSGKLAPKAGAAGPPSSKSPSRTPAGPSAVALGKRPIEVIDSSDEEESLPKHPRLSVNQIGKLPLGKSSATIGDRPIMIAVRPRHLREIRLQDLEPESEPETSPLPVTHQTATATIDEQSQQVAAGEDPQQAAAPAAGDDYDVRVYDVTFSGQILLTSSERRALGNSRRFQGTYTIEGNVMFDSQNGIFGRDEDDNMDETE